MFDAFTGAGNSFLGGLAAGLLLAGGDVYEGVSAARKRFAA
jgi:hypothetical protein